MKAQKQSLFDKKLVGPAVLDSFRKLNPASLAKNPVIFITALVAALASALLVRDLEGLAAEYERSRPQRVPKWSGRFATGRWAHTI